MFPFGSQKSCAPYVPSSPRIIHAMLDLAHVTEADVVCDLGCGDGRILVTAVTEFHAQHGIGYELDVRRAQATRQSLQQRGLHKRVTIIQGDLFDADVTSATVITLYLTRAGNARVRPKLEQEAPWGTRVVSHSFAIDGWTPTQCQRVDGDPLYLYHVPDAFLTLFTLDLNAPRASETV